MGVSGTLLAPMPHYPLVCPPKLPRHGNKQSETAIVIVPLPKNAVLLALFLKRHNNNHWGLQLCRGSAWLLPLGSLYPAAATLAPILATPFYLSLHLRLSVNVGSVPTECKNSLNSSNGGVVNSRMLKVIVARQMEMWLYNHSQLCIVMYRTYNESMQHSTHFLI